LHLSYNFGLINGNRWHAFADDHHIERKDLPRLLVLKRSHAVDSFFVDYSGARGPKEMRQFLVAVAAGLVPGEYEGLWGFPARTWHRAVYYSPPLKALDFLPNWSFVLVVVPFVLYLLVSLLLWQPKRGRASKGEKQQ